MGLKGSLRNVSTGVSAIPDSVVNQYLVEDFTESNWPDSEGDVDINTISGLSVESNAIGDTDAVVGDGTDDYGQADGAPDIDLSGSWAVSVPFETEADETERMIAFDESGDSRFDLIANGGGFSGNINNLGIRITDENGNSLRTDTQTDFADGEPHHLILQASSPSLDDLEFYVDDMENEQDKGGDRDDGLNDFDEFNESYYFSYANTDSNLDGAMGDIRWFNDTLDEHERKNVQSALPFDPNA